MEGIALIGEPRARHSAYIAKRCAHQLVYCVFDRFSPSSYFSKGSRQVWLTASLALFRPACLSRVALYVHACWVRCACCWLAINVVLSLRKWRLNLLANDSRLPCCCCAMYLGQLRWSPGSRKISRDDHVGSADVFST